ncbi:MAG: SWIM zinc finger family protein [Nitrososphaeraceae archaeon]
MTQQVMKYETRNVRRLTKEGIGVWEVQSSRHPQLLYKVVLDMNNDKISCGCPAWKYHSCEGVCKHMLKVMEAEDSGIDY